MEENKDIQETTNYKKLSTEAFLDTFQFLTRLLSAVWIQAREL